MNPIDEAYRQTLQARYDAMKHAKPAGCGLWHVAIGDSRPMTADELVTEMQHCIDEIVKLGFQPYL